MKPSATVCRTAQDAYGTAGGWPDKSLQIKDLSEGRDGSTPRMTGLKHYCFTLDY
jgi:hypothetical protein